MSDLPNLDEKWKVPAEYYQSGVCVRCVHKFSGANGCDAFPTGGIPLEIASGKNDHSLPFPGDHGVVFETKAAT